MPDKDTEATAGAPGVVPPPGRCNATALRKAMRRVSLLYDAALAPSGLRSTQRSILLHIARMDRPSMGELAASLVLDRSALAHNLKPLERDGLIETVMDGRDKRSRVAVLTQAGWAKLCETAPMWDDAQRCFETAFGAEEAQGLRKALDLVASAHFIEAFDAAKRQDGKPE